MDHEAFQGSWFVFQAETVKRGHMSHGQNSLKGTSWGLYEISIKGLLVCVVGVLTVADIKQGPEFFEDPLHLQTARQRSLVTAWPLFMSLPPFLIQRYVTTKTFVDS